MWTIVAVYLAVIMLVHLPFVQRWLGEEVSGLIAAKLGTKAKVEKVRLGFLNRVVVDGFELYDQRGKLMLRAARLAAKIDYAELVGRSGDISWKELSKLLETPARPVEVDIPLLLLRCDRYLDDILHGRGIGAPAREELERLVETLVSRRLTPLTVTLTTPRRTAKSSTWLWKCAVQPWVTMISSRPSSSRTFSSVPSIPKVYHTGGKSATK